MPNPTLVCFGEVLWDVLPAMKIAGGAPMNVAFHANQLGLRARMISRVGRDALGDELLAFLNAKGVSTHLVQSDDMHPTGTVNVTLNEKGAPRYSIAQPVAWDFIQSDPAITDAVTGADAFVFGSLACRSEQTRNTLFELLDVARLRVLDVNLRAPFYSERLLGNLLDRADMVKMNDEELPILAGYGGVSGTETGMMEFLRKRYRLDTLIVTRGAAGAIVLDKNGFWEHGGFRIQVEDTIGSGDAFLAAFLSTFLHGGPTADCLRLACAVGALVATKKGGTPDISTAEIDELLHEKK